MTVKINLIFQDKIISCEEPVAQTTKREQISLLRRNGKKHEEKA
jgi:hypothetical protein